MTRRSISMEEYKELVIEVVDFDEEDVITSSDCPGNECPME